MDFDKELENLAEEDEALKNSVALNKILHSLLVESKKEKFRLWIIILCLIIALVLESVGFFIYEAQFEQVEESTETTWSYSEASGENSAINNVQGDQYNDQAVKNNYGEASEWQQDK